MHRLNSFWNCVKNTPEKTVAELIVLAISWVRDRRQNNSPVVTWELAVPVPSVACAKLFALASLLARIGLALTACSILSSQATVRLLAVRAL